MAILSMREPVNRAVDAVKAVVTTAIVLFALIFFTSSYMKGIDELLAIWAGVEHTSGVVGLAITAVALVVAFANVFALLVFGYTFRAKLRANRQIES